MNSPQLLKTVRRACRNCTWDGALWVKYLKVAERKDPTQLNEIKSNALKVSFCVLIDELTKGLEICCSGFSTISQFLERILYEHVE